MTPEQVSQAKKMAEDTLLQSLDIQISEVKSGYVEGTMPVDHRTHQPYGLLHGGATVALAETLGSVGSHFAVDSTQFGAVGVEVNCNHLKSVRSGRVTGKARMIHQGRKMHVWNVEVFNEEEELVATSRLTVMIISKP
ncbi:MAG: PaaI family thioesterase [Flavobacteriales bacterium]|nr:PaaI family thioesterase [Flavobacteriales bacterium]